MKKIFAIILALTLCAGLCACGMSVNIEDTNGDDPSLCSITEEDIVSGSIGSTTFGSVKTTFNSTTIFKVKKMSGVLTLDTFKSANQNKAYTVTLSSNLVSGNLRVVLLCDGKYAADFPLNETQTLVFDNPECKYELVLAAESAEFSVEYAVTEEDIYE